MQSANEKFGMRVRELREHKRLGQEQLGKQLGVKKQTVSNWERGRASPDLETLTLICAYFQVSPNELFGSEMPRLNSADASHIRLAAIANVVPLYSMTEGGTMLAKTTEKIAARAYLPVHVDHSDDAFAFTVDKKTASAMGPKFREDDHVVVDPNTVNQVEPGQAVLAMVDGEIVFRYYRPGSGNEAAELRPSPRGAEKGWPALRLGAQDSVLAVMTEHSTAHHD